MIEHALLGFGLLLIGVYALAHLHRLVMVRVEMARFESKSLESKSPSITVEPGDRAPDAYVDHGERRPAGIGLWSSERVKAYEASMGESVEPLAVLRIARLNLEVPVLEGTDDLTLNRGVGRIQSTSLPGQGGNIGIAGHRDGFFRSLKDIRTGDTIDLATSSGTSVYIVDRVWVTDRNDLSVLSARERPSLTLVTCYPFYFVGPAPDRYIVEASLQQ